jgi:hypothetical protein
MSLDLEAIQRRAANARHLAMKVPLPPRGEMPLIPLSVREHFDEDMPRMLAELERLTTENAVLRERLRGSR